MDGPSLSGRERRTLARLEESLAQDEQLTELLRVFDEPAPQAAPRTRVRRPRVEFSFGTPRPGTPQWSAILRWSALLLAGASAGLLVAALLTGAPVVVFAAAGVAVPALLLLGALVYLRWHPDGPTGMRIGRRAHPTQAQRGWPRTSQQQGGEPDRDDDRRRTD
ncbi:hypothetical protein [Embleya sp. AB8]|uniref:hypothetical protein n=1 Tax=Embleya sp. AB8 TaxID=3156304 RepID=UPI003C784327